MEATALDKFINSLDSLVKYLNGFHLDKKFMFDLISRPGYLALKGLFHPLSAQGGTLPPPSSWMKQLPASGWEHMGLMIGGGATNYARETAKGVRELVTVAKELKNHWVKQSKGNRTIFVPYHNNP